jgi:hypothetical protein
MKQLAQDIYSAVAAGRLKEPFSAADVREACPGYADSTPGTFLPKHRIGNPGGNTRLFKRVPPGLYETIPSGWKDWSSITGRPIPPGH